MIGMYRGDFVRMVRQAALPYTCIKFICSRHGRQDTMSIVDYDLPRREGVINTGNSESDWYHQSLICNVGVLEHSWVPYHSIDDDKMLVRGIDSTIKILLKDNCIRVTPEMSATLRQIGANRA